MICIKPWIERIIKAKKKSSIHKSMFKTEEKKYEKMPIFQRRKKEFIDKKKKTHAIR